MQSLSFSLAACLVAATLAVAQYQSAEPTGYNNRQSAYQQRKLAPQPRSYTAGPQQQQQQQQYNSAPAYSAPAPTARYALTPAATYSTPKAVAKYEEPYHAPSPFSWGYDINDGYGGAQYHKESGDEYGKRTGSYGYTDAYGIYRQVDYVADENGFRAVIKSNEPGVDEKPQSPADVELHHYEPPTNHYAAANNNNYQQQQAPAAYSAPKQTYSAPAAYQQPAAVQSYAPVKSYSAPKPVAAYRQAATYAQPQPQPQQPQQQQQQQQHYQQQRESVYDNSGPYAAAGNLAPVYQKFRPKQQY